MENQDTTGKVPPATPSMADEATSAETQWIRQRPELMVPVIAWSLLCTCWLSKSATLPHFLMMLPFGCLLGFVLFFITAVLFGDGPKTTVELGCGGVIGLVLALIMTPVFLQAKDKARQQLCADNVRALSQALTLYTQDNDGYLPLGKDWETDTRSYFPRTVGKEERTVSFPVKCPTASGNVSYALYQSLAGSRLTSLSDTSTTPFVFDSDVRLGTLAQSPQPGRHRGGNIVGYADGHTRWQKMKPPTPARPRFYVQAQVARRR